MDFGRDFIAVKYVALFNNNDDSDMDGFELSVLSANSLSQDLVNFSGFFFCSYDYKNHIETLFSKNISPLKFDDFIFFKPEKKTSFRDLKKLNFPKVNTLTKIKLNSKTSKSDYIKNATRLKEHIQEGDI